MTLLTTKVFLGDSREALKQFPDGCFNLIFTSPPYADARKNHYDSVTPEKYPEFFLSFHEQLWRVLADDGSFVLNIKDKVVDGVRDRYVWKTMLALSDLGWRCVDDYLWVKPNAMPGYWPNRLRDEWEYCFHLTKNSKFAMYQNAVRRPMKDWAEKRLAKLNGKSAERHDSENESGFGRDLRNWLGKQEALPGNVVNVALVGKNMGHPAAFPVTLPEFFVKLFTKEGDSVLDPFGGSGSTAIACENLKRNAVLIEKKDEYFEATIKRLGKIPPINRERHYLRVDDQTCEVIPSATLFEALVEVEHKPQASAKRYPFQYALLRYVHDAVTGEFLNIGLVMFSKPANFFRAQLLTQYRRITGTFPNVDGEFYQRYARRLQAAFDKLTTEIVSTQTHLFDNTPAELSAILPIVLPKDDSALQFSEMRGGATDDLDQFFETLFARTVTHYLERPEHASRTDEDIWSKFRKPLRVEYSQPTVGWD